MSTHARGAEAREHELEQQAATATPEAAVALLPGGPLSTGLIQRLQRSAGNAAVGALIAREGEPGAAAAGPSVKHTLTFPEKKLGEKSLDYVTVALSLGATVDYEFTPGAAPAAGAGAQAVPQGSPQGAPPPESSSPPPASGASGEPAGPTPLPSPKEGELKGSGGLNVSGDDLKYQAEVGIEFEKRATGLLEGCTPKAKIGGETDGDKGGKLGLEFSLEGDTFEPKFAFNLLEMDAQKGIHFAQLETAVDWKIHEWSFNAADGVPLKVSPKATLKVAIEPNYEAIFQYLLEEGGLEVLADAAIAGGMILAGAAAVIGTLTTLGDGEDEAIAVENAEKIRDQIAGGFVMGATGEPGNFKGDWDMEGYLRGKQWRDDLQAGRRGKGIPVPPSVIEVKSKEAKEKLQESAQQTANQMLHEELVRRYWEIHYAQRYLPWTEIDTVFMMLVEGQGFGRPAPQEGKNVGGASLLPG